LLACAFLSTMGCISSTPKKTESTKDAPKTLIVSEPEAKPAAAGKSEPMAQVDVTQLLNEVFDQLDVNGDGFISKDELSSSLDHVLECSHVETRKVFRTLLAESGMNPYIGDFEQLDTNQDGKISRQEFQSNMHPSKAATTVEQLLKGVFDSIDANKDGNLSRTELSAAFEHLLTCSDLKSMKNVRTLMVDAGLNTEFYVFEQLDANSDGKVTWEEFRANLQPAFDHVEFLKSVFNKLDSNGDGRISREELTEAFDRVLDCSDRKSKKSMRTLLADAGVNPEFYVFEQLDTDHDGKITWDEFEANLSPATAETATAEPAVVDAVQPALQNPSALGTADEVEIFVEDADGATKSAICCL